MATHRSALKRIRRNERRRQYNRSKRTRVRRAIKQLRGALEAGNLEQARTCLRPTVSLIDRLARSRVIHQKTAARTKSRLTRHLRRLESKAAPA
ncbi:MAG: 30S ribosomal protein S20 [Acidobacteriota bacterium]